MTVDWDGRIRMDPSSPYAMQRLIDIKDRYDIAFACDTDHDRHGIVTAHAGLLPPNHYLAVAIDYLFRHRPQWSAAGRSGQDRGQHRPDRSRERAAGSARFTKCRSDSSGFRRPVRRLARFRRRRERRGELSSAGWLGLDHRQGWHRARPAGSRDHRAHVAAIPAPCTARLPTSWAVRWPTASRRRRPRQQKQALAALAPEDFDARELAGEPITSIVDTAPGNGAPIGGIKVMTANGWFAARPSGTEDIYKIYAESFDDEDHLQRILEEAQAIVDKAISAP